MYKKSVSTEKVYSNCGNVKTILHGLVPSGGTFLVNVVFSFLDMRPQMSGTHQIWRAGSCS